MSGFVKDRDPCPLFQFCRVSNSDRQTWKRNPASAREKAKLSRFLSKYSMTSQWLQEKGNHIIVQRLYTDEENANKRNSRETLDKSSNPHDEYHFVTYEASMFWMGELETSFGSLWVLSLSLCLHRDL